MEYFRKGESTPEAGPAPVRSKKTWRGWTTAAVVLAVVVVLFLKWREAGMNGGQQFAEPFRIAGNLYYVGANDISTFLITGPNGHVLLDGGYPRTPQLIMASIAKLGFDIRDVKVLLNSEPHYDHAGGLADLQRASGAELWAGEANAEAIESGGDSHDTALPLRLLNWMQLTRYPSARVQHRFKDGDTIRVGPTAITAHITPGHTRGCTTYSFQVIDAGRTLDVVSVCSLVVLGGSRYAGFEADLEHTFRTLRGLPADIWVTSHARGWGRYRKFVARDTARSPADPFIDPAGYRAYVDSAEASYRRGEVH